MAQGRPVSDSGLTGRQQLDAVMKAAKARRRSPKPTPDKRGRMHPTEQEAQWFDGLIDREDRGEIADLHAEPNYNALIVPIAKLCPACLAHAVSIGVVKADAIYIDGDRHGGRYQIDDFKGWMGDTPLSRFKRKLAMALYQIDIRIVGPTADAKARKKAKRALERDLRRRSKQ